jgi:ABC-type transport system involved in cytochrome bd biosynthesis fused ATPase/permease subunit
MKRIYLKMKNGKLITRILKEQFHELHKFLKPFSSMGKAIEIPFYLFKYRIFFNKKAAIILQLLCFQLFLKH